MYVKCNFSQLICKFVWNSITSSHTHLGCRNGDAGVVGVVEVVGVVGVVIGVVEVVVVRGVREVKWVVVE